MQNESMHPLNLFQHSSSTTVFCVALATLVPELITFCFVPARALIVVGVTPLRPRETVVCGALFVFAAGDGVAERPRTPVAFAARAPTTPEDFTAAEPEDCEEDPELRAFPRDGVAPYASSPPIRNANINNTFFNGIPPIIFHILS